MYLITSFPARVKFVKESLTFTGEDSPMSQLLISVMGAFAEFERALIRERQREGIALAKIRGVYKGRTKVLSDNQVTKLRQRAKAGEPKAMLLREFGISRDTLYRYIKPRPSDKSLSRALDSEPDLPSDRERTITIDPVYQMS